MNGLIILIFEVFLCIVLSYACSKKMRREESPIAAEVTDVNKTDPRIENIIAAVGTEIKVSFTTGEQNYTTVKYGRRRDDLIPLSSGSNLPVGYIQTNYRVAVDANMVHLTNENVSYKDAGYISCCSSISDSKAETLLHIIVLDSEVQCNSWTNSNDTHVQAACSVKSSDPSPILKWMSFSQDGKETPIRSASKIKKRITNYTYKLESIAVVSKYDAAKVPLVCQLSLPFVPDSNAPNHVNSCRIQYSSASTEFPSTKMYKRRTTEMSWTREDYDNAISLRVKPAKSNEQELCSNHNGFSPQSVILLVGGLIFETVILVIVIAILIAFCIRSKIKSKTACYTCRGRNKAVNSQTSTAEGRYTTAIQCNETPGSGYQLLSKVAVNQPLYAYIGSNQLHDNQTEAPVHSIEVREAAAETKFATMKQSTSGYTSLNPTKAQKGSTLPASHRSEASTSSDINMKNLLEKLELNLKLNTLDSRAVPDVNQSAVPEASCSPLYEQIDRCKS